VVGDDGGDIETGLEHGGHLIPSFVHFTSVDALDGEAVEDDGVPIDRDARFWDAEEGNFPAVGHVGDEVVEGVFVAGHFERDVEAFGHAEFCLDVGNFFVADVDDTGGAESFGKFEALRVEVGDDDVASSSVFADGGGHAADGAGPGDEDVFPKKGEGEGGVGGISVGVKDGGDVERDAGGVLPDVGGGEGDEFGKGSGGGDADACGVSTKVAATSEAVSADAADEVAFSGDDVSGF